MIGLLLESLRPSIKNVLRDACLTSCEDLFERAIQAEADESEENPRKDSRKTSRSKTATPSVTTGMEPQRSRPLPQVNDHFPNVFKMAFRNLIQEHIFVFHDGGCLKQSLAAV